MQLVCFHHAGSSGAMFTTWRRALGPGVEVVPVEIENRGQFATLRQLVDEVNDRLRPTLDGPHAFFGHSFGALVAYRLACARAASGAPLPRGLFLSSFAPPHLPAPIPPVDHLDHGQLATLLSELGGIPSELDEWPVLRDRAVAAARIDLRLCTTDEDTGQVALPCPIYAFGGADDPLVSESDLREWRSRTTGDFSVQILPGGHFYLGEGPDVFAALRPLLSRLPGLSRPC